MSGPPHCRSFKITLKNTTLVGTSDQPYAQTSICQHIVGLLARYRHPCPRRDSNPQSQQVNNRTVTPYIARLLGSAHYSYGQPQIKIHVKYINPLTPNDHYSGRTAPITSKRSVLYIYSTNVGTEYFKHGIFFSKCSLFHNCNVFGSCIIHILYTGCAKIKKIIPAPKG